ncbi:MAG TPA: carboxypeptidase regulatory-like domain-containing protein [Vicinamibacterales bacterium]|nr:carboxypeptidase regulatory-like domain-containing protein [Vicinamibacterales bacterium]
MNPRTLRVAGFYLVLCAALAAPAWAQTGAIEGVVRDVSGGVLPGVTTEVSSPALIERARVAVTDSSGNYQFLRLPAGSYTIKFSLTGFRTVERANITINAGFTATINAELPLSTVEESLVVTGESPLVDVRTTTTQLVVTDDVVNTIPSSRHIFDMQKFVIGASTSVPDVGGSSGFMSTTFRLHGSTEKNLYIDGVSTAGTGAGGGLISYASTGAHQELDYQTTALPAWYPFGGIAVGSVTKSGGNRLSGDFYAGTMMGQSANLDDNLRRRGVRATSGMRDVYDIDGGLGGPIKQDRAWFFVTNRTSMLDTYVGNSFEADNVTQATDWSWRGETFYKSTVRVGDSARLSVFNTTQYYDRAQRRDALFVTPEATYYDAHNHDNVFLTATLTGTRGTKWLYELQSNFTRRLVYNFANNLVQPGAVARFDIAQNLLYGAPSRTGHSTQNGRHVNGAVTRVGNWHGSHELKMGVQSYKGGEIRYVDKAHNALLDGDFFQVRFQNGVPNSVDLKNTPIVGADAHISHLGFYAQDGWRVNRLTVNGGLRFERFDSSIPPQTSPAGTWVGERRFEGFHVITFRNVMPRLGMAYDLTGDAKTVLKASYGGYVSAEGTGLPNSINPLRDDTNRCAWTDRNGDLYPQASELSSCQGFPGVRTRIDPDLRRGWSNEYSAGVQRQIAANWAGAVMYYRRENKNNRGTKNLAVPRESYIPVVITNPLDNQPLTIFNQNPATSGQQDNVLVADPLLNTTYNGVELTVQRRFSPDAYIQGGYHYGKDLGWIGGTSDLNDPNNEIFGIGAVGTDQPHQVKMSASWVLPWRIAVSTFFQAYSGIPKARTLNVGRALVPALTRATQTVRLERNDEARYESNKLIDLRIGRRFSSGSTWRYNYEIFVDIYNVTNANTVLQENTIIGTSLGNVSTTIPPRLFRIGGKVSF